jgi:hypothetical protein
MLTYLATLFGIYKPRYKPGDILHNKQMNITIRILFAGSFDEAPQEVLNKVHQKYPSREPTLYVYEILDGPNIEYLIDRVSWDNAYGIDKAYVYENTYIDDKIFKKEVGK